LSIFDKPWVGYLPDCQHRHYPNFFSAKEIADRNRSFVHMLHTASCILVNANAVAKDLWSFFPDETANIVSLPFSPLMRSESAVSVIEETPFVRQKYATGDKYFIISNQFWIHKDHATAFKAFAMILKDQSLRDYKLVCTGVMEDYRFPGYFSELLVLLDSLGIRDKVIFTGYIDKFEQLALLNGAEIMVQPTLCEGGPGGGVAYDAVALGVPSILSNIDVNLEINDPTVAFFDAGDKYALADSIRHTIHHMGPRLGVSELLLRSNDYAKKLGLCLFDIANICNKNS